MRRALFLALFVACYAYFLIYFTQRPWQPTVDLAWLLGVICWAAAFWSNDKPSAPKLSQPYWFYALYFLALIPFGANWRWVMAGDNLSWALMGQSIAEHGRPDQTLLSVNGADNFGFLQMNLHDMFMYLVKPTIFWHRVGKVLIGTCALASVYTVFARLVRPSFGLLVAGCAVTCSVWMVYTYASVPFIDGLASGYALWAVGLWVRRDPDSLKAWLTLGLLSGFMLFLTPNGWFMAVCIWPWLGVLTLVKRWRFDYLLLAATTAGIVGLPMLIQWTQGEGGQLFSLVENPGWTLDKVRRFLQQAALFPIFSDLEDSGAFGPQLPWLFRWLMVPGILIAPLFPRRFPNARQVLAIMAVHVVILAFAQGPYAGVSVKRAMVLIPMATYFVFILLHPWLTRLYVVLPLIALWASFGVNDLVNHIKPGRIGYTLIDGVMEAYQRFAPARVCVYLGKDQRAENFVPDAPLYRLYQLDSRLQLVAAPEDPACTEILCYCPQEQCPHADLAALGFTEIPMMDTNELKCGRKGGT